MPSRFRSFAFSCSLRVADLTRQRPHQAHRIDLGGGPAEVWIFGVHGAGDADEVGVIREECVIGDDVLVEI